MQSTHKLYMTRLYINLRVNLSLNLTYLLIFRGRLKGWDHHNRQWWASWDPTCKRSYSLRIAMWQWIWSKNRTSQSITLSLFLSTPHKHVWRWLLLSEVRSDRCTNSHSPEWVQKGPCSSGVVLLCEVHQRRERQHGHTDEQHQQPQLLVRLEERKFPRAVTVGYFVSVWNRKNCYGKGVEFSSARQPFHLGPCPVHLHSEPRCTITLNFDSCI